MTAIRHWSRPLSPQFPRLCAVVAVDANGVSTACRGGWKNTEPAETFALDAVQPAQACPVCWGAFVDQRSQLGLRELLEGTYSRVGLAARALREELARWSPAVASAFDAWLGPCAHGCSPIATCAVCWVVRSTEPAA